MGKGRALERLAGELGLLPDGALEIINEPAFERCGAPLSKGAKGTRRSRSTPGTRGDTA